MGRLKKKKRLWIETLNYWGWPETKRLPDICPAKMVYSESAKNCNSGSATMGNHMKVPTHYGKENALIKRKMKLGGYGKQRLHGFSLAEFFQGKELFFLLGSAIIADCENSLFWSPNSNWGFWSLIFYIKHIFYTRKCCWKVSIYFIMLFINQSWRTIISFPIL